MLINSKYCDYAGKKEIFVMLYMFVFIMLIICIIIFKHPHNTYSIIISSELFSMSLFLVAIVFTNLILSNFTYTYSFEYTIYQFISRLPISYFDISMLFNLSAVIFLISSFLLTVTDNVSTFRKYRFAPIIVYSAVTLISFLYLNSTDFIEYIYLMEAQNITGAVYLRFAVQAAINLTCGVGIIFPIIKILRQLFITRFYAKQHFLIITLALQLILDLFFLGCIVLTTLSNFYANFDLYTFDSSRTALFSHLAVWQLTLILLFAVGIVILSINFNEKAFYPKRHLPNKTAVIAKDMRSIFHSCKNMLFMTDILADTAIKNYGTDDGLNALLTIKKKNNIFRQKVNHFLDIYNKPQLNYQTSDILQCISRAVESALIVPYIKLEIINRAFDSTFFGDALLIEEVLINLLNNASDAIAQKNCGEGIIRIEVWNEYKWLCLGIRDNGIGISRKNRRHIFKPFFSTKQSLTGWGVGLCYSKNIITAHGGYICFKSKPESFTEFQISLSSENM